MALPKVINISIQEKEKVIQWLRGGFCSQKDLRYAFATYPAVCINYLIELLGRLNKNGM